MLPVIALGLGLFGIIALVSSASRRRGLQGATPAPPPEAVRAVQEVLDREANRQASDSAPAPDRRGDEVTAERPAPAPIPTDGPRLAPPPEGYNPTAARATARALSDHLRSRGPRRVNRRLVSAFQRAAGIRVDGLYGGETRGALVYYGVENPPAAFTGNRETRTYIPPA